MTAFLAVLVPEADRFIGHLRERWDPSTRRGLGSHITIRYPFLPPERLTARDQQQLAGSVASVRAFDFCLARVSRFPSTIFLDPAPVAPFAALRAAVDSVFGTRLPVDSFPRYVPHVSVARNVRGHASVVLEGLDAELAAGPIACRCHELVLLDRHGGPWQVQERYPLAN